MTSLSTIEDKSPKPPGLVPKHVQSWLLAGLAVLMVVIMWLTSGKKPAAPARTLPAGPAVEAPLEVNEAKIVELQNRIAQLQREQVVAQNALAQQNRAFAGTPDTQTAAPANGATQSGAEDSIREERKKRDYLSLFSSNVALTFRRSAEARTPEAAAAPVPSDAAPLAEILKPLAAAAVPQVSTPPLKESPAERDRKEELRNPVGALAAAAGKTYVLFEGTILETVLLNRLDGQFSGPVECLLTTDVYSHDRQHLLIPAGAKILGESKRVEAFGQTRLAVVFHRVLMPDGYSASLDRFQGLNQPGDAGLHDQVNHHYLRLFGVSLAIGAIGAVAEAGTNGALTASGSDLMRQGFAQSMGQSSAQILDRFLNVLPTVTIREGHRVKVYLSGDLALPDYSAHAMPSNL
jgi:type IV secretion system protein TrbI